MEKINRNKIRNDKRILKESNIFSAVESVLDANDIPKYYYSFDGLFDDSYCVVKNGTEWRLFYFERGMKTFVCKNASLKKVCEKLIEELVPKRNKKRAIKLFEEKCSDELKKEQNTDIAGESPQFKPSKVKSRKTKADIVVTNVTEIKKVTQTLPNIKTQGLETKKIKAGKIAMKKNVKKSATIDKRKSRDIEK